MTKSYLTKQSDTWAGEFGKEYTDRNPLSVKELDDLYKKDYGIGRRKMNEEFLQGLARDIKILEIGANIGLQLEMLRSMEFQNLLGVEINNYAVLQAKKLHPQVDVIHGSAFDLPFRDGNFDLAFTSGVLIHISPADLEKAVKEIYRVSGRYIWGFEYFSSEPAEVKYRGNEDLLWKRDFAEFYLTKFPTAQLIKEKKFKFLGSEDTSQMFLLEKQKS